MTVFGWAAIVAARGAAMIVDLEYVGPMRPHHQAASRPFPSRPPGRLPRAPDGSLLNLAEDKGSYERKEGSSNAGRRGFKR